MNDIQGFKIKGRQAKLIQAVCTGNYSQTIVKAVFIGVKEEVKAVCADVIARQDIFLESGPCQRLQPDNRYSVRSRVRRIPTFDYDVGEVFYPSVLGTIVTGNDATIALHAFPLFQHHYGASIPLLTEFSSVLWELALANAYPTEITGVGLPEGERVFTLTFPKLEVFEQHLLERMPQIYSLAREMVNDSKAAAARAA